jgi:hypothetical protein
MTLLALTGLIGTLLYGVWAVIVLTVVNRLRAAEPALYADLGSPAGSKVLWRPFGSPELDPLILRREFRNVEIHDPFLRRLLELAYWVRWSLLVSAVAFAFAFLGESLSHHAP